MERAILSQDKEAIEQFSPRCFPERHSPDFPEWLTFPLKQVPGGSLTGVVKESFFVCFLLDVAWWLENGLLLVCQELTLLGIISFFCMTAGNENRGIQPLVLSKQCRYQSIYHSSLCCLTAEENTECSSIKERSLCLKWKTCACVERYLGKK